MITYAIKINDRYFKDYVYLDKNNKGRYAGNTGLGNNFQEGDIVDIITTELPERKEIGRSVGNTVSLLVSIDKLRGKVIEIIPLEE